MDSYLNESFRRGNVQLFVGSGLSINNYFSGTEFAAKLLDDPIYHDTKQTTLNSILGAGMKVSLEDACEFYELYQGTAALIRKIKDEYGNPRQPGEIHRLLWKLPHIRWIYTTNFDCLIEDALSRPKQSPEVITRGKDIQSLPANRRVVFKPHGCARMSSDREEFVLTRSDYLNYSHRRTLEMVKTLHDISTKVFLFLGYSLRDLNMRHIIAEANLLGEVQSYAVLKNPSGPETRYWQDHGVTLIDMDAYEFVNDVLKSYPDHEFEWDEKVDARVEEKEQIATKALEILLAQAEKEIALNVILDAGSSALYLARGLARKIEQVHTVSNNLRVVTNSPEVMEALELAVRRLEGRTLTYQIGGPLRLSTRAYTPPLGSAEHQLSNVLDSNARTIAFLGATCLDSDGLKTKTPSETPIKKAFVDASTEIYILADHSKNRHLEDGHVFADWDPSRMTIVTDRVSEMSSLLKHVKEIV